MTAAGRGCVKTHAYPFFCTRQGQQTACGSILSNFVDQEPAEFKSGKLIYGFHTVSVDFRQWWTRLTPRCSWTGMLCSMQPSHGIRRFVERLVTLENTWQIFEPHFCYVGPDGIQCEPGKTRRIGEPQ